MSPVSPPPYVSSLPPGVQRCCCCVLLYPCLMHDPETPVCSGQLVGYRTIEGTLIHLCPLHLALYEQDAATAPDVV